MPYELRIPSMHRNDYQVMVACAFPFALLSGYVLYGNKYVNSGGSFAGITLLLFAINCLLFFPYHLTGIRVAKRLPQDRYVAHRIAITIGLFLLISAAFLNLLLRWLDHTQAFGYRYRQDHFWNLYAALGTLNIFLAFVHESVTYFNRYKAVAIETQALKKEYTRSRLLGLQSQVSPHFLFNNLNTLSSLIHEDNEKAEIYLDELSKVYRYLLRNNDVQLVPLQTEASFLWSYVYLLQQRHGSGLKLEMNLSAAQLQMLIPPLTLQMIVENIVSHNSLSKSAPLNIIVHSAGDNWLEVRNNTQPRLGSDEGGLDESLDNIINKIHLLCRNEVSISNTNTERIIQIPLITCREEVSA